MRAVAIKNDAGPISALYIDPAFPVPKPSGSQALVKIHSFGLNRMDLLQRQGNYPLPPQAPKTLGVEFSGVIVALPDNAASHHCERANEHFALGDAVFGLAYGGAYAEYIAVSTHMLIRKPAKLSWEVCAGIPETWITATQALFQIGQFKAGDSVLWHAGASSVSIAGIQLSVAAGAKQVLVTASTAAKIEFCKTLGATEGFSYKDEKDWSEAVLKYTDGKGVDVIIDFVGASYFDQNINAVARDGRIVNLGALGGTTVQGPVDIGRFLRKRARYEGSSLRSRDEEYQGKLRNRLVENALPRFVDGRFRVPVEKVFGFSEEGVRAAHELLASSQTMGKIIVNVESE